MLVFRGYGPDFDEPCAQTRVDPAYFIPPMEMRQIQALHGSVGGASAFPADELAPAGFLCDAAGQNTTEILTRAAAMQYRMIRGIGTRDDSTARAAATAQLAVTGGAKWRQFSRFRPQDDGILETTRARLRTALGTEPNDDGLRSSVAMVLDAAYTAAWALRGPPSVRTTLRPTLGWMGVCAEADSPHRPVNVPSAPYPQFDMELRGLGAYYMRCRYLIASRDISAGPAFPGPSSRHLPPEPQPSIPEDARVVLFIHGHGSRLEECLSLVPWIHDIGAMFEQNFVVVAVDLPSRGYSTMHSHESFGVPAAFNERIPKWPADRRYPILEMYERFIGSFLVGLSERLGRRLTNLTIVGGSLGGNLCMRLANRLGFSSMTAEQRQFFREAVYVAWSPASVWQSFVRGHDHWKNETLRILRDRTRPTPDGEDVAHVRKDFFNKVYYEPAAGAGAVGLPPYSTGAGMWYRGDDWQDCKEIMIEQGTYETLEVYSEQYRSLHWRVALEQLIYSHHDRRAGTSRGPASFTQIDRPLMLLAGVHDNFEYAKIHDATLRIAEQLPDLPGYGIFLRDTGHSIQAERPRFLANQIVNFTLDSR